MKPLARLLLTLIQLAAIELQIYSLSITIAGREECLACVRDPLLLARMQLTQDMTRAEVRRLERLAEVLSNRLADALQVAA